MTDMSLQYIPCIYRVTGSNTILNYVVNHNKSTILKSNLKKDKQKSIFTYPHAVIFRLGKKGSEAFLTESWRLPKDL